MATYIEFEGFRMDARTRNMLVEARRISGLTLRITQGGFNNGAVSASAGTHDGGGALDISAHYMTDAEIAEAIRRLRQVGFAAWHRMPSQGPWVEHIHCIAVDCSSLSKGAANQVKAYRKGKNGLANNGPDDGDQLYVKNTWESYQAGLAAKNGTRVSLSSIAYAARGGYFHSGQKVAEESARAAVRWMNRQKVVSDRDLRIWETRLRDAKAADTKAAWTYAGEQYAGMVRRYQVRFGLFPDGVVGPKTKAHLKAMLTKYSFRVVA
ncbi:hypothetical protein HPO96_37020 [Kribbella sandramycini]|uniref:Peptidoglycan binding protein n=1 Tax=Kribbella sandramycini TaxID=60450 RepID=A0A7Y4L7M0_9ACTN|nr:hypothetical protein [Kribbella sandramycini]MBB6564400.1 hypothetical protein [Kribbella sandramycini]NOL45862.1 hypothetical protein [Kribbella sandramycini]